MQKSVIKKMVGVTLLEILIVLVVISTIMYGIIGYIQQSVLDTQVDIAVGQMQKIMNASLVFYANNGSWPEVANGVWPGNGIGCMQANTAQTGAKIPCNVAYLPNTLNNPFGSHGGSTYGTWLNSAYPNIYTVIAPVNAGSQTLDVANLIASKIPMASVEDNIGTHAPCTSSDTACYVAAQIVAPTQTLSNASAVNFGSVYHHGACVPVPVCPLDKNGQAMYAQIMVVPTSVSGVSDSGSSNVYPISSFAAYALGGNNTTPPSCNSSPSYNNSVGSDCSTAPNNGAITSAYWRVCMQVITAKQSVASTNTGSPPWGKYATMVAITRCVSPTEPAGSAAPVYSN